MQSLLDTYKILIWCSLISVSLIDMNDRMTALGKLSAGNV